MNRLRVVSIGKASAVAPDTGGLNVSPDADVIALDPTVSGALWHASPAVDAGATRFRGLDSALAALRPDVVYLRADPGSSLAVRAARACGTRIGFVIEAGTGPASETNLGRRAMAAARARRTLARADALIVSHASALSSMRRLGFGGFGIVAGRTVQPVTPEERTKARRLLEIPGNGALVLGWAGPLHARSGVFDMLEAVALSDGVYLVLPAAGPAFQETTDRADALEILDRVRFHSGSDVSERGGASVDLAAMPEMLGAVDAIVVPSRRYTGSLASELYTIEIAQAAGLPIIYSGQTDLAAAVGSGGWAASLRDPAVLAQLLGCLQADPTHQQTAALAASRRIPRRDSVTCPAAEFSIALHAAQQHRRVTGRSPRWLAARWFGLGAKRQPSQT